MPRNVLVTGASRGIGRAVAVRLGRDGWRPLVHYRTNREMAGEAAEQAGGVAAPFGADLSNPDDCGRLWDWAASQGPVHGLVNNAGVYRPLDFTRSTDEEFDENWRSHYETNFGGTLRLTRRFARAAIEGGLEGARILNVCSRVGFRGEAGAAAYAASKAAQINLVRSLAMEMAAAGVSVFGIAPGWVDTAMARPGMEERRDEIVAGIPLGRVATPDDCAAVAAFLFSDEAAYLSGQVIDVNGASYFH
ncbi:MAG: SDR family oxidoreductase [Armatimonadetes bacterium]|nr:SDR family oxidoreductase [Armatimonadota bacterium]